MIIGKSPLTSLISQCGLWLRLCLPYCLVTRSLFTIQCILHCQPLQCLYTAQCILHIAYFMYTTQCTLNNNVHTLQDTEVQNLPKKAADSNGSTLLSNWQHNQPQWLHQVEERFHQVEESFTDRRWLTKSWVQCSFWVATVQTVCCAVYTSGGALLDTQLGRGAIQPVKNGWMTRWPVRHACFQCTILFSKGLSRVKDGDKLCAGVEVVAHQVGQLLVRVRLHLLLMIEGLPWTLCVSGAERRTLFLPSRTEVIMVMVLAGLQTLPTQRGGYWRLYWIIICSNAVVFHLLKA